MVGLPTGTVTFLFTDVEGSTRMWERAPETMSAALARHDAVLRDVIEGHGGYVFKTMGDACCAAFPATPGALEAALAAQRALFAEEWDETIGTLRVRMALHTGVADERGGDYFGPPLNRVARLLSAGHGGQVLLSHATQELVRDELPEATGLRDLGERRLKDLFRPERVFQLTTPDLPESFPPLRTLDARRNNLPAQPTPLVGREREVAEVCGLLREEGTRLLTLTGPGGTGKTRVGLQVAAELLEEFEDGVFFVELAPLIDPALVVSEVAGALGIRETGERSLIEVLRDYLREKRMLLLLDNFEQVLEAAHVVRELLVASRVKVLVTSRIALRLYGEHEYAVPPLAVPDPRRLPEPEAVSQYEAVRLFIEHARAARADFAITDQNAPAIAEICVRLDGLPLAIELAAARTKLLPPLPLLARLDNRLKFLTGGARDLPERQRTLRSAIEWSHELLGPDERMLFRRLSAFVGGFSLEAVEAVCDAGGELSLGTLGGISSLLDNSLIRQEEGSEDDPRFSMLETIREYARERLEESGEAEELRGLHAGYFLALAEEADPAVEGAQQGTWLERLEEEHDNLRAVLSRALEAEDSEAALRMGAALGEFWYLRGHYGEGRRWLEAALAKTDRAPPARARALHRASWLAFLQGDLDRAKGASEEGLGLDGVRHFRTGGGDSVAAELRRTLGISAISQGNSEQATKLFEESLALSQEAGSVRG
ncbi:MAG: ATP-binding protein, partial [Rubrobacter sp.]